jgi:hypothetical protein
LQVNFSQRIDLHIYGVVWAVTNTSDGQGAPLGSAAPWSDFEGHRRFVENVYPVSSLTIHPLPGIGAQAPNPQPFGNLTESRAWATNKLNELPSGSILNLLDNWDTGGIHGYAWDKACEEQNARDGRIGRVMAQEVAHCLGLWWHTFSEETPYPRADGTIGRNEIGIDLTGSQPALVVGAAPVYDIMSYQERTWTSVFTYLKLLEAIPKNDAFPFHIPEDANNILFGIIQDGGGIIRVGGHLHPVPPSPPIRDLFVMTVMDDLAHSMSPDRTRAIRRTLMQQIMQIAEEQLKQIG